MRPIPPRPRFQDWPERLAALVEARLAEPHRWGTHDCCLFGADAVAAQTGADPAAAWRGRYASEAEAETLLAATGGLVATLEQAMAAAGLPELSTTDLARRGDLVLIRQGNTLALAVMLDGQAAAPGPDGLSFVQPDAALRGWAV